MKTSYIAALTLSIVTAISPTVGFAMTGAPAKEPVSSTKVAPFCTALPNRVTAAQARFAKEQMERQANLTKDDATFVQHRAANDQKLATRRAEWDTARVASFAKLEAHPGHYSASSIAAYEASIKGAVAAKNSANDAATQMYRASVEQAIASRRSTVQQNLSARNAAIQVALQAAETSCTAGTDTATIKSTLQASVKQAQDSFKAADSTAMSTYKAQVLQFQQARATVERSNYVTFKAAVDAARQTLKATAPAVTASAPAVTASAPAVTASATPTK